MGDSESVWAAVSESLLAARRIYAAFRALGREVYDFRNPRPGGGGKTPTSIPDPLAVLHCAYCGRELRSVAVLYRRACCGSASCVGRAIVDTGGTI